MRPRRKPPGEMGGPWAHLTGSFPKGPLFPLMLLTGLLFLLSGLVSRHKAAR
jgi:hypothetical protein